MSKAFLDKTLQKIYSNVDCLRITRFMLKNFSEWQDVDYEQIKYMVNEIRLNTSPQSFLPFVYVYLNIDLFTYYRQQVNTIWQTKAEEKRVEYFELYTFDYKFREQMLAKYKIKEEDIQNIHERLVCQGAVPVLFRGQGYKRKLS